MTGDQDNTARLLEKLEILMKRQESFQQEIKDLRTEILELQSKQAATESFEPIAEPAAGPGLAGSMSVADQPAMIPLTETKAQEKPAPSAVEQNLWESVIESHASKESRSPWFKANLEKFIGENLINKIGIVILVIGVGIGTKYAIDHDLISPLTRILLGYVLGLGLLGFAIRLKKEYHNFSSVLLSGSMAIMYFMTFAAYSFYSLIPLTLTFALMLLITIFTVAAAMLYDRQVIAHIGLVGAYAVPFLLSDNSGKVLILYTYMAIINAGILVIAVRKYWKPLYYSAFILTWTIFLWWYISTVNADNDFAIARIFSSIFFLTFYVIFLAYKLLKNEKFRIDDIILLLVNSSVFYGIGYALLYHHAGGEKFLGLFTLCNALLHFAVSILIYRVKNSDRNLFYFTAGLVIAFLTIAIPVQLDGCWISMLWSAEAAALFRIGRTKNTTVYELLSYALMVLAFFSLTLGWPGAYYSLGNWPESAKLIPLFNINFLTSLLFIAAFVFINIINRKEQFISPLNKSKALLTAFNFIMPGMLLLVFYLSFFMEISGYFNQLYAVTMITADKGAGGAMQYANEMIPVYKTVSTFIYSLLFLSLLAYYNILRLKKSLLGLINLGFSFAAVGLFLTFGLIALGTLRETYLDQDLAQYFYRGSMLIGIRYVCFVFLALILHSVYRCIRQEFIGTNLRMEFDLFLHITILTILSNELINWMDLAGSQASYKLGLSILFGVYSLILIVLGIWKKKLHLRIAAIVLFSLTLLKLFFYDLSSLDTIAKTIVFVVLGVLLLIISFLYTKYRKVIFGDDKE